ncbi:MAG: lmo0937 family membrane protein [Terriglobales bacterium]
MTTVSTGLLAETVDANLVIETLHFERKVSMLWTIFVILLVLWFLGLVTSYTLGGFIHILLVLAVITLIFNLISGRRSAI